MSGYFHYAKAVLFNLDLTPRLGTRHSDNGKLIVGSKTEMNTEKMEVGADAKRAARLQFRAMLHEVSAIASVR